MCWDADDYGEFYRSLDRTARKNHRCDGCGSPIEPGERYHYSVGKYDGYFLDSKACLPCRALSAALGAHCRRREPWSTDAPLDDLRSAIDEEVRHGDFDPDEVREKWRLRRMALEFDRRATGVA